MSDTMTTPSPTLPADLAQKPAIPGDRVVAWGVALILLGAAGLKAWQIATGRPPTADEWLQSRTGSILQVLAEYLLAVALLSGLRPRWSWTVTVLCFLAFAAVTFSMAIAGRASCGCFGSLTIHPWVTFALDVLVLACLLVWRPSRGNSPPFPHLPAEVRGRVAAACCALGAVGAVWLHSVEPVRRESTTDMGKPGDFVLLEPQTWEGRPFPLLSHIDMGGKLSVGRWTVVLYRHDCGHCREVVPQYAHRAQRTMDQADAARTALVEMPPYAGPADDLIPAGTPCVIGRLDQSRDWFVQTPVIIHLSDGRVVGAAEEGAPAQAPDPEMSSTGRSIVLPSVSVASHPSRRQE